MDNLATGERLALLQRRLAVMGFRFDFFTLHVFADGADGVNVVFVTSNHLTALDRKNIREAWEQICKESPHVDV